MTQSGERSDRPGDGSSPDERSLARRVLPDRPFADPLSADGRTLLALAAVTLVALALRLYDLGGRVFHWDEGRVGYWTLRYAESGVFSYEPIIHGPFLRIVNANLFAVLPATDATARLVVALVGGLLPLSAWLFRDYLDRAELVALAALLAANPLLVYYSRFMRNDVLVGAFAVVALGFALRALATRRVWHCYPAAVALALSLTTKANTLLYVLCFLGAATLVADHRLVRRARAGESVRGVLWSWGGRARDAARDAAGGWPLVAAIPIHLVGLAAAFLAVIVFFYAPRPMLFTALGDPAMWSAVVREATVGSAEELVDLWIAGDMQDNPYLEYVGHEVETLGYGAAVVCVFALVGFAVDGYGSGGSAAAGTRERARGGSDDDRGDREGSDGGTSPAAADGGVPGVPAGRSRAFVAFATYWGLASLAGYPAATDIDAPWSAVHIVLPLAIPAAVGVAYVAREGLAALRTADRETAVLAALVLLAATAGVAAPNATYWNSTDADHTEMVQWAQPQNDVRASLDDLEAAAAANDPGETDVLFVGAELPTRSNAFYVDNESISPEVGAPGGWYDRLPLPWYYERANATVDSLPPDADHEAALADAPPVVIVPVENRSAVDPHLGDEYVAREHFLRLWSFEAVFYVDESAVPAGEADRESVAAAGPDRESLPAVEASRAPAAGVEESRAPDAGAAATRAAIADAEATRP